MDTIYIQLEKIIQEGDDQKVIDFLKDHIKEFPEEIQDKIIFSFFENALLEKSDTEQNIKDIQKELLKQKSELEKEGRSIDDEEKIIDIKESLSQ